MARVTKRADGRYRVSVYVGVNEQGKKQYKSVYEKTQRETLRKADELKLKIGKGIVIFIKTRQIYVEYITILC